MKIKKIMVVFLGVATLFLLLGLVAKKNGEVYNTRKKEYSTQTVNFKNESSTDTLNMIKNRKPGIYYFGFKTCPWCVELLPMLEETLIRKKITAYAIDTKSEDFLSADDTDLEKDYKEFTHSTDTLTVPFILAIYESGEIKAHKGTVTSHDATVAPLNNDQKKELETILDDIVHK
jgi:predicted bacteriocin transport accessory protein